MATSPGDELALATLLHALVPPSVVQAEARILAGQATEEAVRRLLEFHQGVVGPVATVFAFALPSEAALAAVARWSPGGIVELGAGEGLWAWLLRRRGVAVHAFDAVTSCPYDGSWGSTVQTGGPMEAACHPGCSLLLCWPPLELECAVGGGGSDGGGSDGGIGSCGCGGSDGGGSSATGGGGERLLSEAPCNLMGLTALRAYAGDVLLYVGEWQGASGTLSELSWRTAAGQAAGRRFQSEVECSWELAELLPLPRWPGFADCLRVFRRRGASSAVEETAAAPARPQPPEPPPPPPPPPPLVIGEAHHPDGSSNQSGGGGGAPPQLGRRLQAMQRLGLCQPPAVAAAVWVARLMGEC